MASCGYVVGTVLISCLVMAADGPKNQSRFPITVWPAWPLGSIEVERWTVAAMDNGELNWTVRLDPQELPREWVLRDLADADLSSDAVVVELLGEYGTIATPYFDPGVVPKSHRGRLSTPPENDAYVPRWWDQRDDATLEDTRWWLRTARGLAAIWYGVQLGTSPQSAWADEGFVGITGETDAWSQFALAIDEGLRPFRTRVEYRREFPGGGFTFGAPRAGLYSAACAQVFDLIVAEETARHCENEPCGRVFVHQLGGAIHGQYRSKGLRFCSPSCARAQTQRQYRRNQNAKKKGEPNG